ncbi:hypothetical protein NP590_02065 [Methylomonas sp. SURF-2]|uniref:C-type lectin domain-containing protein n=1 Tax=Methylomonas subterranea TaxID=2952225 RepID=A0ABT1TBN6_9GAMM|nr:hypothetical protein [Methylomonas sp. SURF-2]MCQ8102877.1 hypothetical protein [Methylomonas sp. SURF-2]
MLISRLTALLFVAASFPSFASPVFNPSNGHYYELHTFTDDWRLDWSEAKAFAGNLTFEGVNGHLATVTSQEEDDFLWHVLAAQGSFLGGFDVSSYNDETGLWQHQAWQWVTGESFSYGNWLPGEPNHWQDGSAETPDNEDYLMYWWPVASDNGRWNDTNLDSSEMTDSGIRYTARGFVVEYAPILTPPVHAPLPASAWLFASGLLLAWRQRGKTA